MRLFLIGTLLLGVASAVRVEPGADASSGASALRSEVAAVDVEFSSSESETSPTRALTDASSAVGLTDACDAAYKILNSNKGYNDAISAVFDQARVVGKAAGEECVKHLSPSASPLGGTCTENAHKYWTAEKMALIAPLELACMEVLPPEEVAPVVWLDEVVITNSPLSILPCLGLELKLGGILPSTSRRRAGTNPTWPVSSPTSTTRASRKIPTCTSADSPCTACECARVTRGARCV